jgi:hypothetical protein
VFHLLRSLVSLIALAGFVWFAVTVPLGRKTLWEHLCAIAETHETHDLVEGAKEAAKPLVDKVGEKLVPDGGVTHTVGKPGSIEQMREDRKWQIRQATRHLADPNKP